MAATRSGSRMPIASSSDAIGTSLRVVEEGYGVAAEAVNVRVSSVNVVSFQGVAVKKELQSAEGRRLACTIAAKKNR